MVSAFRACPAMHSFTEMGHAPRRECVSPLRARGGRAAETDSAQQDWPP
jgi:hypothetical protein